MSEISWTETVRFVHDRAHYCCEYCRTCQRVSGQAMHVEHINPSGGDHPDNLCLACANCNLSKAQATAATDLETKKLVELFNPRQQRWIDHFDWIDEGARIKGKTPTGRATVQRLKMNIERIITARRIWVKAEAHPPTELNS
jgi:hypothetical protein